MLVMAESLPEVRAAQAVAFELGQQGSVVLMVEWGVGEHVAKRFGMRIILARVEA